MNPERLPNRLIENILKSELVRSKLNEFLNRELEPESLKAIQKVYKESKGNIDSFLKKTCFQRKRIPLPWTKNELKFGQNIVKEKLVKKFNF